jgi:hypothetical protein
MSTEELNASISLICGSDPHPVPIAQKRSLRFTQKSRHTNESHRHHDSRNQPLQGQSLHHRSSHRSLRRSPMESPSTLYLPLPAQPSLLPTHHHSFRRPSKKYANPPTQSYSEFTWRQQNVSTRRRPRSTHPRSTQTPPSTHYPRNFPGRLDTAQLIAGVSAPLLEYPSLTHPHLTDPWLDSRRSFLTECDAKLTVSPAWTLTLHRTKDRIIMEVAEISKTTSIDLRHVNQCRLCLKVQRLSDLRNGAGTEFLPKALSHKYHSHNVEPNLTWPRQGEPSPRAWATSKNYQIPIPWYNSISPNTILRKGLTDQNSIGGGRMYSGQISQDFQTVHNANRPQGSHDRHANAATFFPTGPQSSSLYSSTRSKINKNSEMKHSKAATAPKIHSSVAPYSRLKLLDSTPTLEINVHSTAPSSHNHSPLS